MSQTAVWPLVAILTMNINTARDKLCLVPCRLLKKQYLMYRLMGEKWDRVIRELSHNRTKSA